MRGVVHNDKGKTALSRQMFKNLKRASSAINQLIKALLRQLSMPLNPERKNTEPIINQEAIDDLAMESAELESFQKIVQKFKDGISPKTKVLGEVRKLLRETLGDKLAQIPEPEKGSEQVPVFGLVSNEFLVAKAIVKVLE